MTSGVFKITKRQKFEQTTPATLWRIEHNMGGFAVIDVYCEVDGKEQKILPAVTNTIDNNVVELTFSTARSGVAYLVV